MGGYSRWRPTFSFRGPDHVEVDLVQLLASDLELEAVELEHLEVERVPGRLAHFRESVPEQLQRQAQAPTAPAAPGNSTPY